MHLSHCSILQINRYATQCQNRDNRSTYARSTQWKPVNHHEMRAFLGLVMAMGIVKKPSIESYWETPGITGTEHFRDVMPRNRFQSILRYLPCSDNETAIPRGQAGYDPLHKISLVVDFFYEVYEKNYRLDIYKKRTYMHEHSYTKFKIINRILWFASSYNYHEAQNLTVMDGALSYLLDLKKHLNPSFILLSV